MSPSNALTTRLVGNVLLLEMSAGENRINLGLIKQVQAALDDVETRPGPLAVVTTGQDRVFSTGLDVASLHGDDGPELVAQFERLAGRLATFPAVTVAAVNGHAYAAGALLALAHDYSIMRDDHGYWCLPEVDLGLSITPALCQLVQSRLIPVTAREALIMGRRYTGPEALTAGIVQRIAPADAVLDEALSFAQDMSSKDRRVVRRHKRALAERHSADVLLTAARTRS